MLFHVTRGREAYTEVMPVVEQAEHAAVTHENGRWRFTVEQAYRIAEMFPGGRWELIEGDIISKMGQKRPHSLAVAILTELLGNLFPGRIQIQLPISLTDQFNEPEPDVVLLHRHTGEFTHDHPGPADVALLIEVSDTTLEMDTKTKKRLYARARIAEYWIVDLVNRRTIVCREPEGDEYKLVRIFSETDEVSSPVAPGLRCSLKTLLPAGHQGR